ncbi:restriction endonuclease subunit S [Desulfomicrobium escambiense]|uniref:restriction endonuclease subunit S n=1 Tax=Desulfomicrobium escambiense TaxID=29503 RepID=UPI0003F60CA8|nr:restriction endonuclease subunit S [Desulfomicrobium escambiense]
MKPGNKCPQGYKQTEVGVIPEDWETRPCSEVSERIMVGIVIRPTQYYVSNGVPAFRSANIREDGINDLDLVFISEESNALLAKSQTRTGDVLTVRTGYPGTSAVVYSRHEGCNCIDLLITRPSKKLDSEWLAIWVNSPSGKEQVLRNQGGLAQKHFNVGDMRNLVVALPPLPEQRAIAEALSDVDELLDALDRLIAKKRDIKQAAMQQLLTGQTRLPGFSGKWEVKRLNALADIHSGGTPSTGESCFWDGEIPWCTPTDITALDGHKYLGETARRITQLGLKASSAELIPGNSVIMTSRATIGECAINVVPVTTNQGFKNFIPFKTTNVEFLYYLLGTHKQGFISLCGGSTFLEISKTQLAAYEVRLPPTQAEQTAIAEVLSDMDVELAALEQRRNKTRRLKQGMMQELLTGRIRLL